MTTTADVWTPPYRSVSCRIPCVCLPHPLFRPCVGAAAAVALPDVGGSGGWLCQYPVAPTASVAVARLMGRVAAVIGVLSYQTAIPVVGRGHSLSFKMTEVLSCSLFRQVGCMTTRCTRDGRCLDPSLSFPALFCPICVSCPPTFSPLCLPSFRPPPCTWVASLLGLYKILPSPILYGV